MEPLDDSLRGETLSSGNDALAAAHGSLKRLMALALVCMLALTGSIFVFLLREVSYVRRQVTGLRQFIVDYETKEVPLMEDFHRKLQAFARAHPDFTPILMKYFGTTNLQIGQAAPAPLPPP